MSTALYRRYRPETFADVIGQEHVTEPLMQALRSERVNHAYLFSGPRGCGKTTSARILARCLNCDQGPTPEPCGECESCVALARGGAGTVDVIEIDAASHGGVEDARDLRERAAFGPAQSRYKVYIIDEAHMVTPHGFNALLKVVEEPPEHVKFIFATTEPDKVLSTIRSRTHHYPFHLVPPQRLTAYLEQMCQAEDVPVEPGVLSFVTRAGAGSVRDSLSVLDQLISGTDERGLTYERTASLLGFTDAELLDAVVDAVGAGDAASVFTQVDKVMESGHDPRRFVEDLLERYRDLIVVLALGERGSSVLPGVPLDQVERMRLQATSYGAGSLIRCADVVAHGLAEMNGAVSYRLLLELICARLLLPGAAGEQGYAARLDRIERRLTVAAAEGSDQAGERRAPSRPAETRGSSRPEPTRAPQAEPAPTESSRVQRPVPPQVEDAGDAPAEPEPDVADMPAPVETARPIETAPTMESVEPIETAPASAIAEPIEPAAQRESGLMNTDAMRRAWPEVLDKVKAMRRVTWSFVSVNTKIVDFDGQRLLLQIATSGQAETFRRGNHAEVVRQALIEAIGVDTRVDATVAGSSGEDQGQPRRPRTRSTDPATAPSADNGPDVGGQAPVARRQREAHTTPAPGQGWEQADSSGAPAWARPADGAANMSQSAAQADSRPSGSTPAVSDAAGDIPAKDDDSLEKSITVGQPVIESVLGGKVIAINDEPRR
ncbi:DNA polymerase III subunits gamma/tau [soil metagenome]